MKLIIILILTTSAIILTPSDDRFAIDLQTLNHIATLSSMDCKCIIRQGILQVKVASSGQHIPILVSTGNTMQEHHTVNLPQQNACIRFHSETITINRQPTTICCFNFNAPGSHNPKLISALLLQKNTNGVTQVELLTTTSHLSSRIKNHLRGLGIELSQNIIYSEPE